MLVSTLGGDATYHLQRTARAPGRDGVRWTAPVLRLAQRWQAARAGGVQA